MKLREQCREMAINEFRAKVLENIRTQMDMYMDDAERLVHVEWRTRAETADTLVSLLKICQELAWDMPYAFCELLCALGEEEDSALMAKVCNPFAWDT